MGILDELKNTAASFLNSKGLDGAKLVGGFTELINSQGGIDGLTKQFQEKGMGELVSSWISTGKNLPITASQIQSVLGPERLAAISGKLGIDPNTAATKLQEYLPVIIDKLTPNGKVENNTVTAESLSSVITSAMK